jgi:hypothetical protein
VRSASSSQTCSIAEIRCIARAAYPDHPDTMAPHPYRMTRVCICESGPHCHRNYSIARLRLFCCLQYVVPYLSIEEPPHNGYLLCIPPHYINPPSPIEFIFPSTLERMPLIIPSNAGCNAIVSSENTLFNYPGIKSMHHGTSYNGCPAKPIKPVLKIKLTC